MYTRKPHPRAHDHDDRRPTTDARDRCDSIRSTRSIDRSIERAIATGERARGSVRRACARESGRDASRLGESDAWTNDETVGKDDDEDDGDDGKCDLDRDDRGGGAFWKDDDAFGCAVWTSARARRGGATTGVRRCVRDGDEGHDDERVGGDADDDD